jgi:hypothetical protein
MSFSITVCTQNSLQFARFLLLPRIQAFLDVWTVLNGKYLERFEGSKYPHLRSRSIYKTVSCPKMWLPCLSFQPTRFSSSAWPPTGKHKDPSKDFKFVYIYEFLSYLTLTKRFVLVLKQEYYRNLKNTKPGIGCVLPNFSFQTHSLKFCVIILFCNVCVYVCVYVYIVCVCMCVVCVCV